jgi:hypothetical protein
MVIDVLLSILQTRSFHKRVKEAKTKNKKQTLEGLQNIRNQILDLLNRNIISEALYEEIVEDIKLNEDRILRNKEGTTVNLVSSKIEDLISTYRFVIPLLSNDIHSVTKKTHRLLKERRQKITYRDSFEKGGYLAILLFRKRIDVILNIILSTDYFYNHHTNSERQEAEKIIELVKKFNTDSILTFKQEKSKKTIFRLEILTTLLTAAGLIATSIGLLATIAGSTIVTNAFEQTIVSFAKNAAFSEAMLTVILSAVSGILGYSLVVIFQKYFSHQKNWYDKLVRTNEVKIKEENILYHLKKLQNKMTEKLYYNDNSNK